MAAAHTRARSSRCQLPITGFAHKAGNGRRPLPAATGTAECQGTAARTWLAEREAHLLPVGYFHVLFTLPVEVANIAFQNKALVYDPLFKRHRRRC